MWMIWITKRKLKEGRLESFHRGYKLGFEMGKVEMLNRMLTQRKVESGEPTTLVEKQIEAILWKAEEDHKEK